MLTTTLKLTNNGGANFSYTVNNSWETTSGATNWNNASSWAAGTIPVTGQPITIKHNLTLDTEINPYPNLATSGFKE